MRSGFREDLLWWLQTDRRITQEHRLVYRGAADHIDFLQAWYHYE